MLAGDNPYSVVGPGRPFDFAWRTPYPLPAFLLALPVAWLPLHVADPLVVAAGAAALAWALTRERLTDPRLLVFASFAYLNAAQMSQWSPLLTAGVLIPSLGFVLAAKPTIACALWIAYPSRRAAILAGSLTGLSLVVWPQWPWDWWPTLQGLTHIRVPILLLGGPFIAVALLRWRRPEARLLVALACVPQSTFLYEAVPLFLVARRVEEAAYLAAATVAVRILWVIQGPLETPELTAQAMGQWIVWLLYLPCLVMVLRRP